MHHRTVCRGHTGLLHQELNLCDLGFPGFALHEAIHGGIPAADNFLASRLATHLIVDDAVACHVDAHVGRRLVGAAAVDALEHGREHRENLHIAVIVDGRLTVGFEVEGVNHIDIV